MRSPETAMGMAGGQPTVGRPQNPSQGVGGVHGFPGSKGSLADGAGALPRARGSWGGFASPGHCPRAAAAWANSSGCSPGWPSAPGSPGRRTRTPRPGAAAARPALGLSPRGERHCHPQRVAGLHPPACGGEPFPKLRQAFDGLRQALGVALRQVAVAQIQRGQRQIRRAGGAKQPRADLASGASCAGAVGERCRYAPPVSTGRVLWAESQHKSAPKSRGWREGCKNRR